jgi:hypothetical protein
MKWKDDHIRRKDKDFQRVSHRMAGNPADIRTWYFQNKSLERYHYTEVTIGFLTLVREVLGHCKTPERMADEYDGCGRWG